MAAMRDIRNNWRNIVILTGAGVSAESGIDTFRTAGGLWERYRPEDVATPEAFARDPDLVLGFYDMRRAAIQEKRPNAAHFALGRLDAEWSKEQGRELLIVTQNIDDLHERAGSQGVMHLHGSIGRFHCNGCQAPYTLHPDDRAAPLPPGCKFCTDYVRPSIVWFGEMLPGRELGAAWRAAEQCDVFLIIGTSGVVYPAAHLPALARRSGAQVIEINPEASDVSDLADVILRAPGGVALPQLLAKVKEQSAVQTR